MWADYAVGLVANACHLGAILDFISLTPERRPSHLAGIMFALGLPLNSVCEIQNSRAFYAGLLTIPVVWSISSLLKMRDRPREGLKVAIKSALLLSLSNAGIILFRAIK